MDLASEERQENLHPPFVPRRQRKNPGPSPLGRSPREITLAAESSSAANEDPTSIAPTEIGNGSSKVNTLDAYSNKPDNKWATLVWRDLTVKMEDRGKRSKKALQSLTGYALPGTVTAVMGPALSGKTVFLEALAGLLPKKSKIFGEVVLNGRPRYLKYGTYAFVNKGDQLIETLTVRETLYYSALLQLPDHIPCAEKIAMVDGIIAAMDLEDFTSVRVGGGCPSRNSLSDSDRRRLTIAIELITKPRLIFADEPFNGLDSVAAYVVMTSFKKLARAGCTIVTTMKQTSADVLFLFNSICLLSKGKMVYFGEPSACLEHFANAGFPCPFFQNPSEHFLRAIDHNFERLKFMQDSGEPDSPWHKMDASVLVRTLGAAYNASNDAAIVETLVIQLSEQEGPLLQSIGHASLPAQLAATVWRSSLAMFRNFRSFWLRVIIYTLLMVSIGTIFYSIGNYSLVRRKGSAMFCIVSFLSITAVTGLPALLEDMKVYRREKDRGHTKPLAFVLGTTFSSIPFLLFLAVLCSSIGYFLIGFHRAINLFTYFALNLFVCLIAVEALLASIVTIIGNVPDTIIAATTIQVIMMLTSGYFRKIEELPEPVWKYPVSYIAFQTYAVQGLLQNEYEGISFPSSTVGAAPVSGNEAIRQAYDNANAFSGKWLNLLVLGGMALTYRVCFYIFVILKEYKVPWFYSKALNCWK